MERRCSGLTWPHLPCVAWTSPHVLMEARSNAVTRGSPLSARLPEKTVATTHVDYLIAKDLQEYSYAYLLTYEPFL